MYESDSILADVKKVLGIPDDYRVFDPDIIMHINSVFMILNQLGVGPEKCFSIEDERDMWNSFADMSQLGAVKSYVYLKVRLLFDPPSSSFVLSSLENQAKELEWRLNVMVDPSRQ